MLADHTSRELRADTSHQASECVSPVEFQFEGLFQRGVDGLDDLPAAGHSPGIGAGQARLCRLMGVASTWTPYRSSQSCSQAAEQKPLSAR